jgi:hypothetical protein
MIYNPYLLSSNYTKTFNPFTIAKANLVAARVFDHATVKAETGIFLVK